MSLRRRRQKKGSAIKSFLLLIILLGGAGALVWKFFYTPTGVEKKADIHAEEGVRALVRIGESQNFVEIPTVGTLWEGESLASREDAGISLTFFEKSTLALDKNSQVTLTKMRQGSDDHSEHIEIFLEKGGAYFSVEQKINPRSEFYILSDDLQFETNGGEFFLSPKSLIVLDGRVQVFSQDRFLETVEFGQEFEISEQKKKRISPDFSKPTWILSEKENPLEEGTIDIGDDVVSLETPREIEPPKTGIILTSPGKNGETIEILEEPTLIKGKVPEGTTKVMINDYTLGKFAPGDRVFKYNASREFGTLEEGSNTYNIVAIGADEEWEATLILVFDESTALSADKDLPEEEEKKQEEQTEEKLEEEVEEEELDDTPVTGSLTITSPQAEDSFEKDIVIIEGTAPSNAVKIVVNDYNLSLFKKGDDTWKYTIKDAFGNREVGEKKIVVKAYDAKKKLLETETITITLEELPQIEKTTTFPIGNVIPRGDYLPPVPPNEDGSPTI